jgi:NAD(P)H dehydrogenase (quinone)
MRVLVLHAPTSESGPDHVAARTAVDAARAAGHVVDAVDLRADGFSSVMTPEERAAYDEADPIIDDRIAAYAELVRAAEALVLVYPTTFTTVPPTMKAFLERVLVPGVGFVLDPRTNKVRPGLGGVRRLVGITTHAAGGRTVRRRHDSGRTLVLRALRMCTGRGTRTGWIALHDADGTDARTLARFTQRVERGMTRL